MMTLNALIASLTKIRDQARLKGETCCYIVLDPKDNDTGIDQIEITCVALGGDHSTEQDAGVAMIVGPMPFRMEGY